MTSFIDGFVKANLPQKTNQPPLLSLCEVKEYLGLDVDDMESDNFLQRIVIPSAISYIKSYTGLKDIEPIEEMKICALILCADFYDNRSNQVSSQVKQNMLLKSILDMHSVNYL